MFLFFSFRCFSRFRRFCTFRRFTFKPECNFLAFFSFKVLGLGGFGNVFEATTHHVKEFLVILVGLLLLMTLQLLQVEGGEGVHWRLFEEVQRDGRGGGVDGGVG